MAERCPCLWCWCLLLCGLHMVCVRRVGQFCVWLLLKCLESLRNTCTSSILTVYNLRPTSLSTTAFLHPVWASLILAMLCSERGLRLLAILLGCFCAHFSCKCFCVGPVSFLACVVVCCAVFGSWGALRVMLHIPEEKTNRLTVQGKGLILSLQPFYDFHSFLCLTIRLLIEGLM